MRVISLVKNHNFEMALDRVVRTVDHIEKYSRRTFMRDDHLGFISTCPSNLGTGMRVSVHLSLKQFYKFRMKEISEKIDVDPKKAAQSQTRSAMMRSYRKRVCNEDEYTDIANEYNCSIKKIKNINPRVKKGVVDDNEFLVDVSNKVKLGRSEVEIVTDLMCCVKELIRKEDDL
jgi:protein-arginine kinase